MIETVCGSFLFASKERTRTQPALIAVCALRIFQEIQCFLVAASLKIMSQSRVDSLRKRRLQYVDLFEDGAQLRHIDVWVSMALFVVNDRETFSQRLSQIGQGTFHCVPVFSRL